jgi:hypothetical protein
LSFGPSGPTAVAARRAATTSSVFYYPIPFTYSGRLFLLKMSSPEPDIPLTPQVSPRTQPLIDYSLNSLSPDTIRTSGSFANAPASGTMNFINETAETWPEQIAAQPEEPLCTTKTLQNFSAVRQRNQRRRLTKDDDPEIKEVHEMAPLLQRLRDWRDSKDSGLLSWLTTRRQPRPPDDELEKLALHYFPARGDLRVRVIDYGNGWARPHQARTLGEVANCNESFRRDISCC